MAQILPASSQLPDVQEGESVNQLFTYTLGTNENFVELKIIKYDKADGIIISDESFSGSYNNVFDFGNNSLKYRQNDVLKSASSWNDIPSDADLYEWRAPSDLQRNFVYQVKLTYDLVTPGTPAVPGESSGTPSTTERKTIENTYTQLVYGNWSKWGNLLRSIVYSRG